MGVRSRHHIRPRGVDLMMDGERGDIDRHRALDHIADAVDTDEIRDGDMREMHAERIDPERVGEFRITRRDMSGDAFTEPQRRENAQTRGKPFLSIVPLLLEILEARRSVPLEKRFVGCLLAGGQIVFGISN